MPFAGPVYITFSIQHHHRRPRTAVVRIRPPLAPPGLGFAGPGAGRRPGHRTGRGPPGIGPGPGRAFRLPGPGRLRPPPPLSGIRHSGHVAVPLPISTPPTRAGSFERITPAIIGSSAAIARLHHHRSRRRIAPPLHCAAGAAAGPVRIRRARSGATITAFHIIQAIRIFFRLPDNERCYQQISSNASRRYAAAALHCHYQRRRAAPRKRRRSSRFQYRLSNNATISSTQPLIPHRHASSRFCFAAFCRSRRPLPLYYAARPLATPAHNARHAASISQHSGAFATSILASDGSTGAPRYHWRHRFGRPCFAGHACQEPPARHARVIAERQHRSLWPGRSSSTPEQFQPLQVAIAAVWLR